MAVANEKLVVARGCVGHGRQPRSGLFMRVPIQTNAERTQALSGITQPHFCPSAVQEIRDQIFQARKSSAVRKVLSRSGNRVGMIHPEDENRGSDRDGRRY